MRLTCPVSGCERHKRPDDLLCKPHWQSLPFVLRHQVLSTYKDFQRAPLCDALVARRRYLEAAVAAIQYVDAQESPLCD